MSDTIFALATAQGRAGLAVIRISGPMARRTAESLAGPVPESRRAVLRWLTFQEDRLDQALVLRFDDGESYTGEEVVELHLHGSIAVVNRVLDVLGGFPETRLAEAGEFTRRALENGKLDLSQVEGLADLIDAETEAQRRQAERVLSGAIGKKVSAWRETLMLAAASIEATIDFADEDVPDDVTPEVPRLLQAMIGDLQAEVRGTRVAERIRSGFEVAIVGAPNVGKSTLLNRLAGREAALTSAFAGTTRDVIEVRMDLNGLPVVLLDTAGIRKTEDPVERMGIDLALRRAESADMRLFLVDQADDPLPLPLQAGDLVFLSRGDLREEGALAVSGATGLGIDRLLDDVAKELQSRVAPDGVMIRERHRLAMESAIRALELALKRLEVRPAMAELAAEDLRLAMQQLSGLIGGIGVEDLLGEIFARFCIGK